MGKVSRSDFDVLVRRASLALQPTEVDELHHAWSLVEPMLERVRGGGCDRSIIEPAQIFRADAWAKHGIEEEDRL